MKSKAIIISFLVIAQIGAFTLKSYTQERDKCPSVVNSDTLLLADETTLTYSKTEAIIICDNETIFRKIHETYGQLFKRFTCNCNHTGKISYKHYVIYMDKGDSQILINWAKKNL